MAIHLRNIQNSVHLQRKPPVRMGFYSLHAGLHVGLALFRILNETGLQETMFGLNPIVLRQILTEINHFQLVAIRQYTGFQVTTFESGFRRKSHPIQIVRQGSRSIGFNGNHLTRLLLQFSYKSLIDEKRRLASRQHNQRSDWILIDCIHNLLQRHHLPCLMLCVTKRTAQVATAEAHEDGRRSAMVAFALQGVEYFVNLIHGLRDFGTSRLRDFETSGRQLAVPQSHSLASINQNSAGRRP